MCFMEQELRIKRSLIPGAGKGVFTKVDIDKDEIITEFTGEKVSHTMGVARFILKQSHSILYLNNTYSLDSYADKDCLATFINDAKGLKRIPYKRNNVLLVRERGRLFVIAKRKITAGEELYMSYGSGYWRAIQTYHMKDGKFLPLKEKTNK